MPKKCTICGHDAKYAIKGTSDYYCEDCADENFADINLLEKIDETKKAEEDAMVDDKITAKEGDDDDSDFDDADEEAGSEEE